MEAVEVVVLMANQVLTALRNTIDWALNMVMPVCNMGGLAVGRKSLLCCLAVVTWLNPK